MNITLRHGDCFEVLKELESNSVGSVICDPPYGLEFMGKSWDKLSRNLLNPTSEADIERLEEYGDSYQGRISKLPDLSKLGEYRNEVQEWHKGWVAEVYRVLKSGGVLKAFSGTRTYHHMAMAMDEVGFDIGLEAWCYGSGFPKSMNISKQLDKMAGVEPKVVGTKTINNNFYATDGHSGEPQEHHRKKEGGVKITEASSSEAKIWEGWGTALKPAWEPVLVGRKPR
tara:strand:- start:7414 stop:8094 length:681 start_codon:yes stop_codon:yes gene_type:complete